MHRRFHALHHLQRVLDKLAVVLDRDVPLLLEVHASVDCQFLSVRFTEGLRPLELPRVALGLEVLVALRTAEPEHLAVVTHEHHPVTGVDVWGVLGVLGGGMDDLKEEIVTMQLGFYSDRSNSNTI